MKIKTLAIFAGIFVTACTAQMEVKNALTERGFAAVRSFEIGQVLHWIPTENQLLPVATIEDVTRSFGQVDSLRVKFETGVEFSGGVNLSDEQIASLESEVSSRTSTVITNATTRAIENVTTTVINDWNARPEVWLNELGISDRGWPADGSPIYVALIYQQTLADKLVVEVDNRAAAGAEFQSSVSNSSGNLKFTITDAASLEIAGNDTPVFYDFAVIRIRNSGEGPKFSQVRAAEVRQQIAEYIVE